MRPALRRGLAGRLAVLVFAAMLLTITWVRSPFPPPERNPYVSFTPLPEAIGLTPAPNMVVEGAWQLSARHGGFGGYSALVMKGADRLIAISDRGGRLDFADPDQAMVEARMSRMFRRGMVPDGLNDAEAATRDGQSGHLWIAYEHGNAIARYHEKSKDVRIVWPAAMAKWPRNIGPESIARLPDGRFIVLSEARRHIFAPDGEGLLFDGDPVEASSQPTRFWFTRPRGYAPSDMTALPDGRVIILMRRLVFPYPPKFAARLFLADPATIRPGGQLAWTQIADLTAPFPMDNYEGITVAPHADGGLTIWLISDDNTLHAQRTLLVKLAWREGAQPQQEIAPAP